MRTSGCPSVEFDLFAKITVQGKDAAPLYRQLTSKDANPKFAGPISWNFEKFPINRQGEVVARFKAGDRAGREGSDRGHRGRVEEEVIAPVAPRAVFR